MESAKPPITLVERPRSKRFRARSNYFVPRDVVWTRPASLPYWPAEVIWSDEGTNTVKARLLDPPEAELLVANLAQEKIAAAQRARRFAKRLAKEKKTKEGKPESSPVDANSDAVSPLMLLDDASEADVVTTNGQRVFFFDRLSTPEELHACVEDRLRRGSHDVSRYEARLYNAVLHANRLVRVPLSPELLKPYMVCGIGVVHSLMRTHISAPRQPHTGTFRPQTAVIRIREGLENALRDLQGFEYIWVLFQFSYAAALATGDGQEAVKKMQGVEESRHGESAEKQQDSSADSSSANVDDKSAVTSSFSDLNLPDGVSADEFTKTFGDPTAPYRQRQGVANSQGFKALIVPPRDSELRGVLATRSPHRPNFIGISCVRLVTVQGLDVHIADHDLLHGTPVLDIKPYLPFCDSHPDARAGWVDELEASGKSKGDHKYDEQHAHVTRVFEDDEDANDATDLTRAE